MSLWQKLFPQIELPAGQWAVWETLHDERIIRRALAQLAVKRMKVGEGMELDHMIRFASAVMNRLESEAEPPKPKPRNLATAVTNHMTDDDARWNR